MEFNRGPDWFWKALELLRASLERYGWFLLLGALAYAYLKPRVQEKLSAFFSQRRDLAREAELEKRRQAMVKKRQEEVERSKKEWLAKKAADEVEQSKKKLKELREKEMRLGMRPRGVAHRLGTGDDDDSLYT